MCRLMSIECWPHVHSKNTSFLVRKTSTTAKWEYIFQLNAWNFSWENYFLLHWSLLGVCCWLMWWIRWDSVELVAPRGHYQLSNRFRRRVCQSSSSTVSIESWPKYRIRMLKCLWLLGIPCDAFRCYCLAMAVSLKWLCSCEHMTTDWPKSVKDRCRHLLSENRNKKKWYSVQTPNRNLKIVHSRTSTVHPSIDFFEKSRLTYTLKAITSRRSAVPDNSNISNVVVERFSFVDIPKMRKRSVLWEGKKSEYEVKKSCIKILNATVKNIRRICWRHTNKFWKKNEVQGCRFLSSTSRRNKINANIFLMNQVRRNSFDILKWRIARTQLHV